ncbi:hypothetical protein EVAR_75931_1 [Eumeta japonica]|uniref:RNase H type-1 domain-containing protein n=1 Tax=Eumeta variegata TaxID=151549 RepID=A0A4C1UXI1_EUMVA|nr:hypothetical protein EVAR_75931_1 [Eumeta japonica]
MPRNWYMPLPIQYSSESQMPPRKLGFIGECRASLEALKYALLLKLHRTLILSDSRNTLESLQSNPFKSKTHNPLIMEIRKNIDQCHERGLQIALAWVPGHLGMQETNTWTW